MKRALALVPLLVLAACSSGQVDTAAMSSDLEKAGIKLTVTPERFVEITRMTCDGSDGEARFAVALMKDKKEIRSVKGTLIGVKHVCPSELSRVTKIVAEVWPSALT